MSSDKAIQHIDELETLRVSSELFSNNLRQEDVLGIVCERALQISQADYCEIFIRHPNGKDFISTIHSPDTEAFSADVRRTAKQLAAEVVEKQRAVTLDGAPLEASLIKLWLASPFKVMGNIVGVLCLGRHNKQPFSIYTTKLLSVFVDQASIAISNAQLFEDLTLAYSKLSQSRAEILESRNTLQTLFDGIDDGLYIVDKNLNIIMVNQAEIKHLDLPRDEIISRCFTDMGWRKAAPDFIELIQKTFSTGQKACWIPSEPDGLTLIKSREMQLYPIITPQGVVQQVIILAQDMTEKKEMQASLFQSANMAAVGQLATSVAHEINNPLTIALTNTQLLMMELGVSHPNYDMVEDIYTSTNRIKNIVTNLVDLANQVDYQHQPFALIETIEEALHLVAHPLRKSKVTVERNYACAPTVIGNRSHLKLAWMSLLLNACDAIVAAKGPGVITIVVMQVAPAKITITISDTGIGIQKKYFNHIFTPFFTTKLNKNSVGLGLFTAHTVIEKHQGHITFKTEPGATDFIITLPSVIPDYS